MLLVRAGVSSSPAPPNNTLGLVTFDGNVTLIFDSITTTNVQIPEDSPLGSLVWFASTGNVSINSWTSSNSTCPRLSAYGLINFDATSIDHIDLQNADALCSPFCFTMGGASKSLDISNSAFQNDRPVDFYPLTTAVWANLTGTLKVSNCSFTGFGTDYGSLSVDAANVTISSCNFTNNAAGTAGGGLFITGTGGWGVLGPQGLVQGWDSSRAAEGGWVWIEDSIFVGNSVHGTGGGGAVQIVNMGNIMINGSRFEQNQAISPGNGAAIHIMGTTRQDANIFLNNTVIEGGNGSCNVLLESVRCVGMKDTIIQDNIGVGMCVHYVGGGCSFNDPIWNFDNCQQDCGIMPFNFDTVSMPQNVSAEIAQFAQFATYGSFTALYSSYNSTGATGNWSSDQSGYLQASQGLCVDIRTSVFRNNTVQILNNTNPFIGGAGLEIRTAQPVVIADCTFQDNLGAQGAAVHLDACPSTLIWNSSFDNNQATYEGGAVALVNSDGQGVLLGGSNFTHNSGEINDSGITKTACVKL